MPELSDKESLELSNYAFRVANNTQKFIAIDLKNPTKGLDEIEEKTQARARLRIKNLRLENNKSQKELAKYLEIDLSTYNKYEKGSRKLSNEVVKKLAEYGNNFEKTAYEYDTMVVDSCETRDDIVHAILKYK